MPPALANADDLRRFGRTPIATLLAKAPVSTSAYAARNARFRDWFARTPDGITAVLGSQSRDARTARAFDVAQTDIVLSADGARSALRPFRIVRDDDTFVADLAPVRAIFAAEGGGVDPPMAHVCAALVQAFVRELTVADRRTAELMRTRRVLFAANHQIRIESYLALLLLRPLAVGLIEIIAREWLRGMWPGVWFDLMRTYPGNRMGEIVRWASYAPNSIFVALDGYRAARASS